MEDPKGEGQAILGVSGKGGGRLKRLPEESLKEEGAELEKWQVSGAGNATPERVPLPPSQPCLGPEPGEGRGRGAGR